MGDELEVTAERLSRDSRVRERLEEMQDRYVAIERLVRPAERIPLEDLEREFDLEG